MRSGLLIFIVAVCFFACENGEDKEQQTARPTTIGTDTNDRSAEEIVAEWINIQDSTTLIFDQDEMFEVYLQKQAEPIYWGQYELNGDTITMINAGVSKVCVNTEGLHLFEIEDRTLRFDRISDTCVARRNLVESDWEKRGR